MDQGNRNNPVPPNYDSGDDDGPVEEGNVVDDDPNNEPIEIDSPDDDEDFPGSPIYSDGYADDDASGRESSDDEAVEDDEPRRQPVELEDESEEDSDDDDMTWESRSTVSEVEDAQPVGDEWYPLPQRNSRLPNFALPTTTRSTLLAQDDKAEKERKSPDSDGASSDEEDEEFQKYEEVMRPNPTRKELATMCLDYFLHYGYADVIGTFCEEMDLPLPEEEIKEMNMRNEVKQMILEGEMEKVIEKLEEISPTIMQDEWINYVVRKQHIIEMIRRDNSSTDPILYFRRHLIRNGKRPDDSKMEVLEKVFSLMVFQPGDTSEFHVYFDQKEREWTAKEVNSAILWALGKPKSSRIDMLAKAVIWMRNEVRLPDDPFNKTSLDYAEQYFSEPYGFQELIDKAIEQKPLDLSQDMC